MLNALVLALAATGVDGGDWLAISRLYTDAYCTKAHDRVSGAIVEDCASATSWSATRLRTDKRLVSDDVLRIGSAELIRLEFKEPAEDVRRLKADLGDEPLDCRTQASIDALTPPSTCDREILLVSAAGAPEEYHYRVVVCSFEQRSRALVYVEARLKGIAARCKSLAHA